MSQHALLAPGTRVRLVRPLVEDPDIPVGTKGVIEETTYALKPERESYYVRFSVRGLDIPYVPSFSSLEDSLTDALAGEAPPLRYHDEIRLLVALDAVEAVK